MMDSDLRELYQEIILDHSRHPRHFGSLDDANRTAEGFNPLCGDKVKIDLVVNEQNCILDIAFDGKGCAISVASASLMSEMLKGRTIEAAENLMSGFLELVKGGSTEELCAEDKENLEVMAGVSEFPMRVKCATLAWHAMKSALDDGGVTKPE